jgi:WD40 repeat protein
MPTAFRAVVLAALLGLTLLLLCAPRGWAQESAAAPPKLPPVWKKLEKEAKLATISADGKFVAVYEMQSWDVVVYRRDTGEEHFRVADCAFEFVAFTPDGKRLVTLAGRHPKGGPSVIEAVVWDVATGKRARSFDLFSIRRDTPFPPVPYGYAASDKELLLVDSDKVVRSFDLESGKRLADFAGGDKAQTPRQLALSRDGKWLLTAGPRGKVKHGLSLWDVEKRKLARELHDGAEPIDALAVSDDGAWCACVTRSKRDGGLYLRLFDARKGEQHAQTPLLMTSTTRLFFSPDGGETVIATGGGAHHGVNVWDWKKSREIRGGFPKGGLIEYRVNPEDKKWNDGGEQGRAVTRGGVLLTMAWGRELRLWRLDDKAEKKEEERKHEKK